MQPFEEIKKYCEDVCGQIRWKKVKPEIAIEIERHLCDQRDAYMTRGDDEASATRKSILQMGDAVLIGQQLDKIHKPKPQWNMLALTGILMLIGFALNFYLGLMINPVGGPSVTYCLIFYVSAIAVLLACYFLDFSALGRYPLQCYFTVILISLAGILTVIATDGIRGRFSIMLNHLPLIFPLVYALLVYGMRNKGLYGVLLCGIGYLPFAAILLMLATVTGLIFYTIAALAILCFAIACGWMDADRKRALLLVLIPVAIAVFGLIALVDIEVRWRVFLNPYEEQFDGGYVYCLIREFLSGAVLFGKGAVPQFAKDITSVPYIYTEYALVYFIHQFGFIMLLGILLAIIVFSVLGVRKISQQKSVLGSLVAFAALATFILQAVSYVASNLGYGFVSSFPMPFIAYGRSALLIDSALIGFMLSVFRTGEIFKDFSNQDIGKHRKNGCPIFTYEDGKLVIDLQRYYKA